MATLKSKLTKNDIVFLTNLINDITNELCECDCCKKEKGCSIFEKIYIASNILYRFVVDTDDSDKIGQINMLDDIVSCIDWETISKRIQFDSSKKGVFVDKSRKKILSRFYKYLYDSINDNSPIIEYNGNYEELTTSIFNNYDNVRQNCLDECCN